MPRDGELTFIPEIIGFEFNPSRRTFQWTDESVHREEFRIRASAELDGHTARGSLSVYLGPILLAEIPLAIKVDSHEVPDAKSAPREAVTARPYRKIFASYSHQDAAVVDQFQQFAKAMGDQYLRDCIDLRAGEVWSDRLAEMIDEADVFQLFWSANSMCSGFVRQEWEHALSLPRASFIRPVYWEAPLPESPKEGLPPETLRRLHFQHIGGIGTPHTALAERAHQAFAEPGLPSPAEVRPVIIARDQIDKTRTVPTLKGQVAANGDGRGLTSPDSMDTSKVVQPIRGAPRGKLYYTESETAEILGVSAERLASFVRDDMLRVFQDGPRKMFKVEEVDSLAIPAKGGPRSSFHRPAASAATNRPRRSRKTRSSRPPASASLATRASRSRPPTRWPSPRSPRPLKSRSPPRASAAARACWT